MSNCIECSKSITKNSPGLVCSGFCGGSYHANSTCSDVAKNQLSAINNLPGVKWICQSCRKQAKSRTRSSADVPEADESSVDDLTSAGNKSMSEFMRTILREMHLLRESVDFCSNKVTDFEQKLQKFNELFKTTEALRAESGVLKGEIMQLSNRVNSLEQFNRSYNVEIQDVPEKPNENLISVVTNIASMFNYKLEINMIDNIFRVPTQIEDKPKNIIIRFLSKLCRDKFLTTVKLARKDLGTNQGFKLDGISNRFYINEHLPPQTKLLLKQAREKARSKNYKFVWIQNGNVLVRKEEKSKIISIARAEELNAL